MAPVCVACRLSLATLFVIVLFVSIVIFNVISLLVYELKTLLDLRPSAKDLVKVDHEGHMTFQPLHFPGGIPTHLRRILVPLPRRKHQCCWGKRSH